MLYVHQLADKYARLLFGAEQVMKSRVFKSLFAENNSLLPPLELMRMRVLRMNHGSKSEDSLTKTVS